MGDRSRARPTIYLSNWSSHKTPGHHGPGRKWTIMARPRQWERGDGTVLRLRPNPIDLDQVRSGGITVAEYRRRYTYEALGMVHHLRPGFMTACHVGGNPIAEPVVVRSGDTLCCACSREAASRGECHRVWAADLLREAGWRVVLDGEEVQDG